MNEEKIKSFINFALGDVAEPRAFSVERNKKGEFYVVALYPGLIYAPKEIVFDEWKKAKENNPEFKDISLYM